MRHNQRIAHFVDKLAAAGVSYRVLWSARRDRKKRPGRHHPMPLPAAPRGTR